MSWCVWLTNCGRPSSRTILIDKNEEETESSRTILTEENEEETESCWSRYEKWRYSKWGIFIMLLLAIIKAAHYHSHSVMNGVWHDGQERAMEQEFAKEQEEMSRIISRSDKKYLNILIQSYNN